MSSSNNELENYGARRSEEEDHQASVDLVPGEEVGLDSAPEPEPAGAAPIDKKKKQMILAGFGAGALLLIGLVLANLMRSPAPQQSAQFQEMAPAPQGDRVQQMPNPGAPAAPLIGDTAQPSLPMAPQNTGLPPGLQPMEAPDQNAATAGAQPAMPGSAPSTAPVATGFPAPVPVGPVASQSQMPANTSAPVAPPPVMGATPVLSGPAPGVPGAVMQAEPRPGANVPVQPSTPAAVEASAVVIAAGKQEIAKLKDENKDLSAELSRLKREVSDLKRQLTNASRPVKTSSSKPAAKPVQVAATRPAELSGIVSQPGAKPVSKSARGDFSIYAVTDGRVWVVGKDGERLGPLAVGSPLTDGSKITGIDVGRGVVLTTAGEIH